MEQANIRSAMILLNDMALSAISYLVTVLISPTIAMDHIPLNTQL